MPTGAETLSNAGEDCDDICRVYGASAQSWPARAIKSMNGGRRAYGRFQAPWPWRIFLAIRLVAPVCMAGVLFAPAASANATEDGTVPLTIVTASGAHKFAVEVMRTDSQRERGLMFRRFLPQDRGMLFDFKTVQPVMMWMKNTYIPLDMIFIAKSGRVVGIAADTEPLSEHIIPSGAPVRAVLEVNAGTAAKIKLKVGDSVRNALFAP